MDREAKIGLLGELAVELQLAKHGWHPVRLDTAQMASNADLIAIKGKRRVTIQVKTTDFEKQRRSGNWMGFGYSTNYLRDSKSFFNSKNSPLLADIVVAVGYVENACKFVVLPVALAEKLCRRHANYWFGVPARKRETLKLGKRSFTFPIYLCFSANRKTHRGHHEQMKRNLQAFADRWDVLDVPIEKLHKRTLWPLLR
ncbi:hypothetical protein [Bradyrhizobium yuanmingense]|uniref:hypothetical protein n=1 Tax=Bradyrhizobium yuanmingense TaxID=108015 RepID=UPI0023B9B1A8|nr:hypothetical protein [Bradyrhizobium yuanmingense]MDF0584954.1 hypothetical protein [Bradyrhizobium yuanmingense]